jgi:flavin-dependent dehydrogenase
VLDALDEVGAADVVDDWTPLWELELAHGATRVGGRMRRPVHVVPREVFDARLVDRAVAAGAELRRHRVTKLVTDRAGVLVDGTYRAGIVVGADGDRSVVREHLLGPRREPRALAIRGYAPVTPELAGRQVIQYGDRRQPSYAWAFDRGDGLTNVGYGELLPGDRTDAPPSRQLLLDQLERLIPGVVATGTSWRGHHLPLSGWRWHQPDGPLLLAGDAAGRDRPVLDAPVEIGPGAGRIAARLAGGLARALLRPHRPTPSPTPTPTEPRTRP